MAFHDRLRYTVRMSFPPITIYTTKTCGYCRATKDLLRKNSVPFTEIDVSSDREKAREMIARSGQMGVPVLFIGEEGSEEMIIGFDESRIRQALSL